MKKPKQEGVYTIWSASILVCMALAVFVLGFTSCKKAEPSPSPKSATQNEAPDTPSEAPGSTSPADIPEPDTQPTPGSATRLGETADMGQEYVDKFVFLGDSTTYGLGYYEAVNKAQVWTPASGTLTLDRWNTATIVYEDATEISIVDAVTKKQPEYMLITLGVNGISFMEEDYFIEVYSALVQAILEASPDTKIILNSIYPATARYASSGTGINNEKITAANGWVERIAEAQGLKYLDSASVLKDENGNLPDSLDNGGDGLHMNGDGYQKVISYIRTHGYQ